VIGWVGLGVSLGVSPLKSDGAPTLVGLNRAIAETVQSRTGLSVIRDWLGWIGCLALDRVIWVFEWCKPIKIGAPGQQPPIVIPKLRAAPAPIFYLAQQAGF